MRYRSRTAREDAYWTAARADLHEQPSTVVTQDADEWRSAARDDLTKTRRVAGTPRDVDDLPDVGDVA